MRHNKNHDNIRNSGPQLVPVRFELTFPTAITICVARTFKQLQTETRNLQITSGGWLKETALMPGTLARQTVPNPFGGINSILKVAGSPEAAHLTGAEHSRLTGKNKFNSKQKR